MWASPHWRCGPHRTGDVGLTARATTQECTQIGGNGPSGPFRGICVHCWAVGLGCGWPWDRNSVHKWEDRASPRRIGAFVYTVGLLRCCGQMRGRKSVHKSAEMVSQRRFGAFVYTVAPWAWVVGSLGIAIVYTNGRIGPLSAVSGHLCTLLRRESRYESRREQPAPDGASASTATACRRRPLAGPSRLVGKTGSERVAPLLGWRLRRGVNPHEPLKSLRLRPANGPVSTDKTHPYAADCGTRWKGRRRLTGLP